MPKPTVAVFAMAGPNHFRRLRPIVSGLSHRGIEVYVFTGQILQAWVEQDGATFVDVFAGRSLESADGESMPVPSRFVSFAGQYAEDAAHEVSRIKPRLVIYDTFAVIGHVVARYLRLPYVNVVAGHNVNPARFVPLLHSDPRVQISTRCLEAVRLLRERYGIANASPFLYVDTMSPFLNLYCEPPQFLSEDERKAFEPIAFFGSLAAVAEFAGGLSSDSLFEASTTDTLNVYLSFGTIIWRYFAAEALTTLAVLADTLAALPHVRAVISLGGYDPGDRATALRRPNVRVENYIDQWNVLRAADVFVTHHGLNSTHEAIFQRVPMISYPFFWDQPAQAALCQALGLAIPLSTAPRGEVTRERVMTVWNEFAAKRARMEARLNVARGWEEQVQAGRAAVLDRIAAML